jgi:hypothetical protein
VADPNSVNAMQNNCEISKTILLSLERSVSTLLMSESRILAYVKSVKVLQG